MKGLLIKDAKIILQNKKFIIFSLVLAAIMSFSQSEFTSSVLFGYITMIFSLLAINTLAYDENDKSIVFLMTLPINRNTYVKEKYIIAFILSFLGFMLTSVFCVVLHPDQAADILIGGIATYIALLLFQMIMIPVRLKFGNEKSGVVALIFAVLVFAVFGVSKSIANHINTQQIWLILSGIDHFIEAFFSMNKLLIAAILCLFVITFCTISFLISTRIMRRKEF